MQKPRITDLKAQLKSLEEAKAATDKLVDALRRSNAEAQAELKGSLHQFVARLDVHQQNQSMSLAASMDELDNIKGILGMKIEKQDEEEQKCQHQSLQA